MDEDIYLPGNPEQAMNLMGDPFVGFQSSPANSERDGARSVKKEKEIEEGAEPSTPTKQTASERPTSVSLPPTTTPLALASVNPTVQNIAATFSLGVPGPLDLADLARRARNAEYNPRRYSALIVRLRDPSCTVLWRASGRAMLMGVRSEADAHLCARRTVRMAIRLGLPAARLRDYKIVNYLGRFAAGFRVNLERMEVAHAQWASYEPQLFPGMVYRLMRPRCTMMIFASGNVCARTREDVVAACNMIYPILGGDAVHSLF